MSPPKPIKPSPKTDTKTVWVTGGAGFIGSTVVRYLLDHTPYRVVNLDKLTYAGNPASIADFRMHPRHVFERVDICDTAAVATLMQRYCPAGIFHLAAETHVDRSIDSPEPFLITNVVGTGLLLHETYRYWRTLPAAGQASFRFLHISTDEVYGDLAPDTEPCSETASYNPSSPYSATKAGSDHLVRAWFRTYGLPTIVTTCSNNYGPYQFPEKLIPHMILNAMSGKALPVYGDGQQIRDWLHVEDHARALLTIMENGRVGETYNISGRNEIANLDVVKRICSLLSDATGVPENDYLDSITFVNDRPGHDRRYALDSQKLQNELQWTPSETFESGLKKTVDWYLSHRDWWEPILSGNYKLDRLGTTI